MQTRVAAIFDKLKTKSWHELDASLSIEALGEQIQGIALQTCAAVQHQPIGVVQPLGQDVLSKQ
jgi:hypothetical protein